MYCYIVMNCFYTSSNTNALYYYSFIIFSLLHVLHISSPKEMTSLYTCVFIWAHTGHTFMLEKDSLRIETSRILCLK
ncbi:hypothetical protein GDO81_015153 [Engystomops pustulosus]|uniref:Uncharacterized protein n=1 Tax=Engystomops pustulosus TaxID=76066 RepID=A0AAV7AH46_ENGPU|nr:hypothetical protein GDO81_015153 [Engystomops pustulosus]